MPPNTSPGGEFNLEDIRIRQWDGKELACAASIPGMGDTVAKQLRVIKEERRDKSTGNNDKSWTGKVTWIHIPCNDMELCADVITRVCEKKQADELLNFEHWWGQVHQLWDMGEFRYQNKDQSGAAESRSPPTASRQPPKTKKVAPQLPSSWMSSESDVPAEISQSSSSQESPRKKVPKTKSLSKKVPLIKFGSRESPSKNEKAHDGIVMTPFMDAAAFNIQFQPGQQWECLKKVRHAENSKGDGKNTVTNTVLYMPYFFWEWLGEHKKNTETRLPDSLRGWQTLVHPRRSLDEAALRSHSRKSLLQRNDDQVVSKFLRDEYGVQQEASTLMVVDQIWLWILDKDTLVTSFPSDRRDKYVCHRDCDYLDLECLAIGQLESKGNDGDHDAERMASHIIYRCYTVLDHRSLKNRALRYFDMFRLSVAGQRANCTDLLQQAKDPYNLQRDIDAVKYIRDIDEELHIIISIVKQQLSALAATKHRHWGIWKRHLTAFKEEMQELQSQAKDIHSMLFQTLEFKQAQLSVRQNQAVLTFTVVTVVFLPLGFISSIFGMNATELSDGSPVGLRRIFTYMFPISLFISMLSLLLAFWGSEIAKGFHDPYTKWVESRRRKGKRNVKDNSDISKYKKEKGKAEGKSKRKGKEESAGAENADYMAHGARV